MIYWRCKCGKAELWESGMTPKDCQGCDECKTTFGTSSTSHVPLIEHSWVPRYDPATGKFSHYMCLRCWTRKKELPQ